MTLRELLLVVFGAAVVAVFYLMATGEPRETNTFRGDGSTPVQVTFPRSLR